MPRTGIITKTILLVSLVSLFNDIASEMLYPVMPVFLKSIGFSVLLIGILEGVAEATAGISKGYFGHLSDVTRKRVPFIQTGYFLSAVSKPLMAVFFHPLWIFFARTLDRLGKGIRTGARDAVLSDETTPENKGKVFGFHRALDTLGAAIGPVIALIFLYFYPDQYIFLFLIAFLPGLAAVFTTLFLRPTGTISGNPKQRVGFFSYFRYWTRSNRQFRILVAGLLLFTLFNSSDVFLLLALKNEGLSDTRMIAVYIFYNLVFALFSYPIGILADKIGLKTTLIAGLLIFALVYLGFSVAASLPFFLILFFFYGIYAASTEGISKALITNIARPEDSATAIGFYTSFASIATLLASSLAGLLWYTLGPQVMFIISGVGVLAVTAYFFVYFMVKK